MRRRRFTRTASCRVFFLYKKKYLSTSTYGPILHEMAHRWANWVVPPVTGHWAPWLGIVGQLNNVSANYADIELYLMGLMDASEMTDPASLDAYALIPADQKPRVPSAATSQRAFRTLLLIRLIGRSPPPRSRTTTTGPPC